MIISVTLLQRWGWTCKLEWGEELFQGVRNILYFDQSGSEVVKIQQAAHLRLDFI